MDDPGHDLGDSVGNVGLELDYLEGSDNADGGSLGGFVTTDKNKILTLAHPSERVLWGRSEPVGRMMFDSEE